MHVAKASGSLGGTYFCMYVYYVDPSRSGMLIEHVTVLCMPNLGAMYVHVSQEGYRHSEEKEAKDRCTDERTMCSH